VTAQENNLSRQLNCTVAEKENCMKRDNTSHFDPILFGCTLVVKRTGSHYWSVEASGCLSQTRPDESPTSQCELTEHDIDARRYICSCRGDFCNRNVTISFAPTFPSSLTSQASKELTKPPEAKRANQKRIIIIIVSACITVLVVAFFALFLKWYWSVCLSTTTRSRL
jgi:hypothetical protein